MNEVNDFLYKPAVEFTPIDIDNYIAYCRSVRSGGKKAKKEQAMQVSSPDAQAVIDKIRSAFKKPSVGITRR